MIELFDSHCHLDDPEFDGDREAVVARARDAGVAGQLLPAIDLPSCDAISALCRSHPGLYPAWGLHPLLLDRHRPEHLETLRTRLESERPHAVGECGLDFYVDGLDPDRQRFYFQRQLELAREFDLPVVLHARRAVEEVTQAIKKVGGLRGVVHSYSGSLEQARQLFDLDFHIGLGGPVTYPRANRLRAIAAAAPQERLLLETDAPDQPNSGRQGTRNEPANLLEVAQVIAELRGTGVATLAAATTANARRLFGIAPG
jgi:TatD DNase family protein